MTRRRLLWAEDNDALFGASQDILKAKLALDGIADVEINRARDGNEAYRKVLEGGYCIAVLDVDMPHFSGLSAAEGLSRNRLKCQLIVVSDKLDDPGVLAKVEALQKAGVVLSFHRRLDVPQWSSAIVAALKSPPCCFLHLSDLHFGEFQLRFGEASFESLFLELANEIEMPRLDGLFVTGDITSMATLDEFRKGEEFLLRLLEKVNLPQSKCYIVPGNHDISWGQKIEWDAFAPYRDFLLRVNPSLCPGAGIYSIPQSGPGLCGAHFVSTVEEAKVLVVGASSVLFMEQERRSGRVDRSQLVKLGQLLKSYKGGVGWQVVLLLHHNLFRKPSIREAGSHEHILLNQADLLEWCTQNDVSLVLHGHSHYQSWCFHRVLEMWDQGQKPGVVVLGAGTAGGRALADGQSSLQCNLVELRPTEGGRRQIYATALRLPLDTGRWRIGNSVKVCMQE